MHITILHQKQINKKMKNFKEAITTCIALNMLEKVQEPSNKDASKKQAQHMLSTTKKGEFSNSDIDKVLNAVDEYTDRELEELMQDSVNKVVDQYHEVKKRMFGRIDGTLDNAPHFGGAGKRINLDNIHFEAWYPELPDLLMGTVDKVGVFNASEFLRRRKSDKNVEDFLCECKVIKTYQNRLKTKEMAFNCDNGDILLNAYLAFSFVEYVDINFSIYMHDRMHELFSNGVIVSDNYLAVAAKRRLPKKVLNQLADKKSSELREL